MSNLLKGVEWGTPTEKERNLIIYLGECIARWIEEYETDRSELMCAIGAISSLLFTKETPIKDLKGQYEEIDAFCNFLKLCVRKEAK